MPRFETSNVAFDVPRDWEDRSVTAFMAPMKPGQQGKVTNLVMTRDKLAPGEDLQRYVDRQFGEIKKHLDDFRLHQRVERPVGGLPGVELRFAWSGHGGPLEQRLLFVLGREQAVITFTATMPRGEGARQNPVFDRIFASITFPDRGSGAEGGA
jgi:hypothetical protein